MSKILAKIESSTPQQVEDRCFNAALDHGAVAGAYTHIAAKASVAGLKRGSAATVGYTTGFASGFAAGWKSVK